MSKNSGTSKDENGTTEGERARSEAVRRSCTYLSCDLNVGEITERREVKPLSIDDLYRYWVLSGERRLDSEEGMLMSKERKVESKGRRLILVRGWCTLGRRHIKKVKED